MDSSFTYAAIAVVLMTIAAALTFVFAFTRAGRLVVDNTRLRLQSLVHREGRIRLSDDEQEP
jgi:hypothetical protein